MGYFQDVVRRHYAFVVRENEKVSAEEAIRTAIEAANALYVAGLADVAGIKEILDEDYQRAMRIRH